MFQEVVRHVLNVSIIHVYVVIRATDCAWLRSQTRVYNQFVPCDSTDGYEYSSEY
jgi:hypothetical protein